MAIRCISRQLKALLRSVTEDADFRALEDMSEVYKKLRTMQEDIQSEIATGRVLESSASGSNSFKWSSLGTGMNSTKRLELIEKAIEAHESVDTVAELRAIPLCGKRAGADFSSYCAS